MATRPWMWTALLAGAMCFPGRIVFAAALGPTSLASFGIQVVERENGWPVSMVTLRTTHNLVWVSDNAGWIAVDQPELMGRDVYVHLEADGYERAPDGFGFRGARFFVEPGGTARLEVDRTAIARRLGRLTGAGRFAHSQRLGLERDESDSGVFGCDSVQLAVHQGRLFWLWGDTTLPHYPLGLFHASSATTPLRPPSGFRPPIRIRFDYFQGPAGRPRNVAEMPGEGPTWLSGYVSLPDRTGRARLVATYAKIQPPLTTYERGLCAWNEESAKFEPVRVIWRAADRTDEPAVVPVGHPVRWTDPEGEAWILFGDPFPTMRCPAQFEAWRDPARWVGIEPPPPLTAFAGGGPVEPHRGSVAWHPWRRRWVTVFTQRFGKPSAFGEVWFAEADAPTGPWDPAVKILSHRNYTFYNPRIHDEWLAADSPSLLFEGTYSREFADRPPPTPRYDYNQILYRLDLDDPRLRSTSGRVEDAGPDVL